MTTRPMMQCGHQANGHRLEDDGTQTPVCVICAGLGNGGDVPAATPPDLTGRTARCTYYGKASRGRSREGPCNSRDANAACMCERPSTDSATGALAFFESRAPGSTDDECVNCPFRREAHVRKQEDPRPHLHDVCDDFTPRTEGHPHDLFYCGCWGWD